MDNEVEQESALTAQHEVVVEHVSREFSSVYERGVANDDIIKMSVKAFSWEVNRNGFQFKKKCLKKVVTDAFKDKIPAYRTWEGKVVDKNHLMQDNGSKVNVPIGYIEAASMKEDGVYFDMVIWKRCLTDEEQRQIREYEVAVSMEVDYSNPIVIVDGEELPNTKSNKKLKGAVRSMADNSVVNGLGVAVLFDGIEPGFASADVLATENAVLNPPTETADSTVPDINKNGVSEAAQYVSNPEENQVENPELNQKLTETEAELAAAKEQLAAKQDELQKAFEEIETLRKQAFDEVVAKNFDLDAIPATTAAWLLDLLRWSYGSTEEVAANLVAVAGCVKSQGTPAPDAGTTTVGEGKDDAAIQPQLPKPIFASLEGENATTDPVVPPVAPTEGEVAASDAKVAAMKAAEAEPLAAAANTAEAKPETVNETAVVNDTVAPVVNIAHGTKSPSGSPKWGIQHF